MKTDHSFYFEIPNMAYQDATPTEFDYLNSVLLEK